MAKNERTSPSVARKASAVLTNPNASPRAKSVAGSALAQAGTAKVTSPSVASKASRIARDGRSSSTNKSIAGSVLTQKPGRRG